MQTTQAHFDNGTKVNVDTASQSGNVTLATSSQAFNSSDGAYDEFAYSGYFYNASVFSDTNDSGLRNPYSGNGSVPYSTINYSDPATGYANKSIVFNNGSIRLSYANENDSLTAWGAETSMAVTRRGVAAVVWNGRVYAIGGNNPSGFLSSVESAPILANGSLGSWRNETNMANARYDPAAVVWNGRIFVLGGSPDGSTVLSSVESAPILANSSLGSWRSEANMANARYRAAAIAWNGRIYIIGGSDVGTPTSSVESASILANGSLGSWRSEANLLTPREGVPAVVWNSRAYALGSSVESAPILANGSLGNWKAETSTLASHYRGGSVVWNGRVYAVGGYNGSVLSFAESAAILANGSIGSWRSEPSMQTTRLGVASIVWNGRVYAVGGYNGTNFLSSAESAVVSSNGSLSSWRNEFSMSTARRELAGVVWNSRLYAFGGYNGTSPGGFLSSVESALVLANGSLGVWRNESSMSTVRSSFAGVVWNGRLYAFGGLSNASNFLSSVESALVLANGSLGVWRNESSMSTARGRLAGVVWNGRLYAFGGHDGTNFLSSVESALILANGSLGAWRNESSMSTARRALAGVVWNGRLYAFGGVSNSTNFLSSVESALVLENGSLGVWRNESSMSTARGRPAGVVWNGRLYAFGGQDGTNDLSSVESALILANGSLGAWRNESSMSTVRFAPAGVVWNGRLYAFGGQDGTNYLSSVESALVTGLSSAGSYISKVFDLGSAATLTSLNWTGYKNNGSMQLSYRSASTLEALGSASWSTPAESSDWDGSVALSGSARYFQYQTNFSRGTSEWTPELNDVTFYYSTPFYLSGGSLVSQVFDAGANATWNNIIWLQYLPSSAANVTLFTRTGASSPPSGAWLPAQGYQSYYPSTTGSYGVASANNTRYLQWMALLNTTDSSQTPVLREVNASYTIP
jgi:N-acetylneuraminic acid mutarotase